MRLRGSTCRSGSRRFSLAALAAACALLWCAGPALADVTPGSGNGTSSHPQAPHPHLTLSAYQYLHDGQLVVVTGTGFCKNNGDPSCQPVFGVEECLAPVNGSKDCDPNTLSSPQHNPGRDDVNGNFQIQVTLRQHISVGGLSVTCDAMGKCAVGASNFINAPDYTPAAYEAIGFGGAPPTAAAASSATATATATPQASMTATATPAPRPTSRVASRVAAVSAGLSGRTQLAIGLTGLGIILAGALGGYVLAGRWRRRGRAP